MGGGGGKGAGGEGGGGSVLGAGSLLVIVIGHSPAYFRLVLTKRNAAQWLDSRNFKSEDPGFDPLAEQGERQFFCPSESTLVQTCFAPDPPFCVRHAPKYVRMLKISYIRLS